MPHVVYGPDEEIPFLFTGNEINIILAMVETTIGFPLRVTMPLKAKIEAQIKAQPPALPGGDGYDEPVVRSSPHNSGTMRGVSRA